ncbi:MAG: hypothetical protein ACRDRT_11105, partial [Pseudonocardiaceae bacterium]
MFLSSAFIFILLAFGSMARADADTTQPCTATDLRQYPSGNAEVMCVAHLVNTSTIYRPPIPGGVRKFTKRPTPKLVRVPTVDHSPDWTLCW